MASHGGTTILKKKKTPMTRFPLFSFILNLKDIIVGMFFFLNVIKCNFPIFPPWNLVFFFLQNISVVSFV